ncbi:hypothetical protein PthBH41_27710 [Parageobacillus thermoglucosidasius]|nr:hypothetical protein PthBH41_27710 [Parageobacillus thermoglucosidasius]
MNIRKAMMEGAKAIAAIYVEGRKTTHEGIVPAEYLAQLNASEKEQLWQCGLQQPKHSILSRRTTAKYAGLFPEAKTALHTGKKRIYAICLLKEAQKKRYGTKLVKALVDEFQREGIRSLTV